MEIVNNQIKVDIYRKPTHVWDLPAWKSRTTPQHKRAAVMPLFIRAHRLLESESIRGIEVQRIFKQAIKKGYPIRILKRWNTEGNEIAKRKKIDNQEKDKFRKIISTNMDTKIRSILKSEKVQMVTRKNNTLFCKLRNDKDRRHKFETPGIYRVPLVRGNRIYRKNPENSGSQITTTSR